MPTDGQVYKASDGNWYRWPDPKPYDSEEAALATAEPAEELPPPPPPRQATGDLLPTWATPLEPSSDRSVWWKQRRVHAAAGVGVALFAVLGVVSLVSGGDKVPSLRKAKTHDISGTFTLIDSDVDSDGSKCWGTGGYDDVEEGLEVTVRDEEGTLLGESELGDSRQHSELACVLSFEIADVPKAKFYSIEVGSRGDLNYSYSEMEEREWKVAFSLS